VSGTGIGGRIRKQDVLAAAEAAKTPEPEPAAAPAGQAPSAKAPTAAPSDGSKRGTTEKMSRLRKTIARRMVESLQVSAQLTTVVEVDVTRISRLRDRAKSDFAQREGTKLSFLPFFQPPPTPNGRSLFTAGIVLAIMILPIVTAISREVFAQTPRLHEEAALALGATRWEMIRYSVFPYARSGMVSAVMLGLGRALGETMAVAMVLAVSPVATLNVVGVAAPATIASNIALNYKEATPSRQSLLIATGLVLFAVTFVVNFLARWIVGRGERKQARA